MADTLRRYHSRQHYELLTFSFWPGIKESQEDVNGEKLTVKRWWILGADFFTVWSDHSVPRGAKSLEIHYTPIPKAWETFAVWEGDRTLVATIRVIGVNM